MEEKGKTVAGEEEMAEPKSREEMAFDSLLRALSDLAKGQKDMLEEINHRTKTEPHLEAFVWRNFWGFLAFRSSLTSSAALQ